MCCQIRSRCLIIFIAIWTLLQSLGYAVMALLGILVYDCELDMNNNRFEYFWFLVYFRNGKDCPEHIDINWQIIDESIGSLQNQPEWAAVTDVASRTNVFVWIYLVMSLLWAINSVCVIVGVFISCLGRCGYHLLFQPYVIVGSLLVIFDVVVSGFFIADAIGMVDVLSFMDFLGITNTNEIYQILQNIPIEFYVPSSLMVVISSRGFVIWCFNIACIVIVANFGKTFAKSMPKPANTPKRPPHQGINNGIGLQPDMRERTRPTQYDAYQETQQFSPNAIVRPQTSQTRYDDPAQHNQYYTNPGFVKDQDDDYTIRRQPALAPHAAIVHQNNREYHDDRYSQYPPPSTAYNKRTPSPEKQPPQQYDRSSSSPDPFPVKNSNRGISPDDSRGTPSQASSNFDQRSNEEKPVKYRPPVPAKPTREDRNSVQNPPPGGELRKQLPWSYTSNPEDISKPKRTFVSLRDDEDLPPVPVPDYTLHFPKNKRQTVGEQDERLEDYIMPSSNRY